MSNDFAAARGVVRARLIEVITAAARGAGATAAHLLGSVGRGDADALSDVDVWLTFPAERMAPVIAARAGLYRAVGDLLLMHESASNRPLGGVYTLALYQTPAGPVQVDWYLAPQATSRVAPEAPALFERAPVPRGEWRLDLTATTAESRAERIDWLIAMLFIAAKMAARGGGSPFLAFLGPAYRDVAASYRLTPAPVATPGSLAAVRAMLAPLAPFADAGQRRASDAVAAFCQALADERAVQERETGGGGDTDERDR